jgi:hypothetical protein
MVNIKLTPGQAVTIFSWWKPREILRWQDVIDNDHITYDSLLSCGLQNKQLHSLQPNISEWARYGQVSLTHASKMVPLWNIDPIADLKVDLGDILFAKLGSETLKSMGITYQRLCDIGMSPDTMRMFGFTMYGWINLGLTRSNVERMTDLQVLAVFAMSKSTALQCFSD